MALLFTGSSTTLDETPGLQNATNSVAVIGDANDNDIATSALPAAFLDRLIALGAGAPTQAALSGYDGAVVSTGSLAVSYTPTGGPVDIFFSDAAGNLLDGVASGLRTTSGQPIMLHTDSQNNNILLGKAGADIVFSAYLEESTIGQAGAKIWMVQYQALENPNALNPDDPVDLMDLVYVTLDQGHDFSLENAPAGQNLFVMFGNTEVAVVATGMRPANESEGASINTGDTINTSNAAGSVTIGVNNQMVNVDEGIYFTFVTGADSNYLVPNLSETEADVEANISFSDVYEAKGATFSIVQLQGDKAATVQITAIHTELETGIGFVDGLGDADDTPVEITSVIVRDAAGSDVTSTVTVENSGGIVTITGVVAGHFISYETNSDHNRLLVENVGTERGTAASFDVDGFHLMSSTRETIEIGSAIRFEDDGPSISLATPADTIVLNTQDADTSGTAYDTDTKDFSGAFSISSQNFGADGTGASGVNWAYALSVTSQGMDSGLTSHGDTIYLYRIAGKVIGSTSNSEPGIASENTVFDISVGSTGTVTLNQYSAMDHDAPGVATNYADQLVTLGNGKVSLTGTATITEADDDSDTEEKAIDLGGNITFNDDGPSISLATPEDSTILNTQDFDTTGTATDTDTDTDTKEFSGAFSVSSQSFGADGSGTAEVAWDYVLSVASQGMDSELTAHGDAIYLYLVAGKVIGSTSATEPGISDENTIFSVSVSSTGAVTLTQAVAVDHAAPGSVTDYASQTLVLPNGKISLTGTATITDADQDTDSDQKTIDLGGNLVFNDDGPAIVLATPADTTVLNTQDADTTGEAFDTDTKDFSSAFTISSQSFGADGSGTSGVSWGFGLSVTSQGMDSDITAKGSAIYLYLISGKVIGSTSSTEIGVAAENTIFDVSVSDAGSVKLTQYTAVDHDPPGSTTNYASQLLTLGDGKIALTGTATITDADGDTDTEEKVLDLGGNLAFNDDGPSITQATPADTIVLNTQDADTSGTAFDTDTKDFSGAFSISSQNFGADGTGASGVTWAYALSVTSQGMDSELTSHGSAIYLYLVAGKVVGSTAPTEPEITGENTVFDVSVTAAGSATLTQYGAVDHASPGTTSNYADQLLTLGNGKVSLTGTATITDADGDSDSEEKVLDLGGNLAFNDDGPAIALSTPSDSLILNTHDALTIGAAFDTDTASFADELTVTSSSYGADGEGSGGTAWAYSLSITSNGIDSGLASNSAIIRLFQMPSGTVVGSIASSAAEVTSDNTVFDLSVDTSGVVTLNQYAQINHPTPGSDSDFESQTVTLGNGLISLTATATIEDYDTDSDSDSKTIDLGGNVVFSDYGPAATAISNLSGPNLADPIYGTYDFSVGADLVNNDEPTGIVLKTLSGSTANGRPISSTSVTWESETDTLVNYRFGFKYYASPDADALQDASGVVVFNKTNGTYLFDISAPLMGEVTYSTSTPVESYYYDTMGNKSPEIVVQKYGDDFYGVLTGQASSPPSKTDTLGSGSDHTYAIGESWSNSATAYVNVATDTLGVNSDTVQAGELLNFDFYTSNPVSGAVSPPQRSSAAVDTTTERAMVDELDITLSQFNSDEDLVILLKLWDPDTDTGSSRLLIADSASDFTLVDGYKVVHVGTEDYDSETYDIIGLQVLSSSEMIQGTGYRLSDGTGKALGSVGSGYQDTADLDVFKIIRIEITHQEVTHYDADLLFNGEVIDHDDDYDGFSFTVHLEADGIVPTDQDFLPGSLTILDPFGP